MLISKDRDELLTSVRIEILQAFAILKNFYGLPGQEGDAALIDKIEAKVTEAVETFNTP